MKYWKPIIGRNFNYCTGKSGGTVKHDDKKVKVAQEVKIAKQINSYNTQP